MNCLIHDFSNGAYSCRRCGLAIREHHMMFGPQKQPSSVAKIQAESKFLSNLFGEFDNGKVRTMTWTCNNFEGHWPTGSAAVVSAENIDMAITLLERSLADKGLPQTIKRTQLIPLPTTSRHVRILCDGIY